MGNNTQIHDHFAHSRLEIPLRVVDAEGSHILTGDGKKYIDFAMGWCVGNLGWKHPAITEAIRSFDGPSYVAPHFAYAPWDELSDLLIKLAPRPLMKCFRATGGTEAVEIALQAAIAHTGRKIIVGLDDAYHGNSIAARAVVKDSPFVSWKRIKPPFDKSSLSKLEEHLKNKDVAAIIMEPVVLNLDVEIPTQEFMTGMEELCRRYGTLIIMDEVACGFGRTGKFFATEHFSIHPDIMCLAKAITGGAAPLGATLMSAEVAETANRKCFPYSTYGWHPLSVTAAIATLKFMDENWTFLEANIRSLNEYFHQRLSQMRFDTEPEIKMMGLAIHLSFEDEDYGQEISKMALKKGLILGEDCSLYPALNLEFQVAKEGLDILESCL